jgi:zinc protease
MTERFSEGLAGFGGGRSFTMPEVPREPPITSPREAIVNKDKEQAHIALGFHGLTFHDRERHALELISAALSGQGGRLFLELRDKQALAYQVTAFTQEALDPGYFCVYMATDPKKLTRAVDGIRVELEKIRRDGLSEDELERNKRQIVGGFEIDLQRAAARAANLAFNDRYGLGYLEYKEYPKRVLAVTREEIVEVARRILDPQKSALSICRPAEVAAAAS